MARHIREENQRAIEEVVRGHPDGITAQEISEALKSAPPHRTLQYRLKSLVDAKRLLIKGSGRWARYGIPREISLEARVTAGIPTVKARIEVMSLLSEPGAEIRKYVHRPPGLREPVGYNREFLYSYRPNDTFYLSETERAHLHEVGRPEMETQPAGTHVKKVLNRLLIDLAWNSIRLEGNTYSLLDTTRLLELGEEAEGKE